MLNIKISNRKSYEDYVALSTASPYILPRKHILGVGTTVVLSAALVLSMPSTWNQLEDGSKMLTVNEKAYLEEDQSAELERAQQRIEAGLDDSQENYEDYDIPSLYFSAEHLAAATSGAGFMNNLHTGERVSALEEQKDEVATHAATATAEETDEIFNQGGNVEGNDLGSGASGNTALASTNTAATLEEIAAAAANDPTLTPAIEADEAEKLATTATATTTTTATTAAAENATAAEIAESDESTESTETVATAEQTTLLADGEVTKEAGDAATKVTLAQAEPPLPRPEGTWYVHHVRSGDNLSAIFSNLNLPYATLNRITKVAGANDLRLRVKEPIYFLIDKENVVMEVVKGTSKTEQVRFTRISASDDFKVVYEGINTHMEEKALAKVDSADNMPLAVAARKEREAKAAQLAAERKAQAERDKRNNVNPNRPRLVINSIARGESFAEAAHRAGLTPSEIKTIEKIFHGKIALKEFRQGDQFRVLFTDIGTSALISAVQLQTSKGKFESFMNPSDSNYYGENEYTPTAGVFRRFPLAGEIKINSQFNPHRRHPVTRRISPHNGVDFKASIGTPVYAPADGLVSFSGYQRAAGYYVIVRHINNYSTVYMHLSKSEVKEGQKVTVGQLIARTGNTGRTTGPHLHYEVRINDRPVDPLKIELPSANHPNLAREQREAFANNVKLLRADLINDRLAAVSKK